MSSKPWSNIASALVDMTLLSLLWTMSFATAITVVELSMSSCGSVRRTWRWRWRSSDAQQRNSREKQYLWYGIPQTMNASRCSRPTGVQQMQGSKRHNPDSFGVPFHVSTLLCGYHQFLAARGVLQRLGNSHAESVKADMEPRMVR